MPSGERDVSRRGLERRHRRHVDGGRDVRVVEVVPAELVADADQHGEPERRRDLVPAALVVDARADPVEDPPRAASCGSRSPPRRLRDDRGDDRGERRADEQPPAHRSVRLASRASTVFVPEIAVSMIDVRFDVSPSRPPTAAETVSLAWIGSARRTARSRCARIAREQLGADDHRADAEHPPRVERRALGRPDPACRRPPARRAPSRR